MKNRKMFLAAITAVGALALGATAFAQDNNPMPTPAGLSVSDQIFIMDLLHSNAREIELSRLVYHNAFHHGLSNFAHMMVDDHSKLQDQLVSSYGNMEFARNWPTAMHGMGDHHRDMDDNYYGMDEGSHNWDLWNYLYQTDWNDIHRLRDMNNYALDTDYIQMMVTDHKELLHEINREKHMTQNSDIQSLISQIEPVVQDHYERAEGISFALDDPFDIKRDDPWVH